MQPVPSSECPVCLACLNCTKAVSHSGNPVPVEGDVTICNRCRTFLTFDKDLHLKLLRDEDFDKISLEIKMIMMRTRAILDQDNNIA